MKNFGDIAMLQTAILRIRELFPGTELHVFTTQPERLQEYCPGVSPILVDYHNEGFRLWSQAWNVFGGIHKFIPQMLHLQLRFFEHYLRNQYPRMMKKWIQKRFKKRNIATESIDHLHTLVCSCDLVIVTGGGFITDAFEAHATSVLYLLSLAQGYNKPTFMFGQGIGPLQSPWLRGLCRQILPRLNLLALRECRASYQLMESLDIQDCHATVTGDDAIEMAYREKPAHLGEKIGINMRVASYSEVGEQLLEQVRLVLHRECRKYHASMVPIPISKHDEDSDITSIVKLTDTFDGNYLNSLDSPNKVIEAVSKCRIVVTGSYHAGVFALSQGISVVGLANSSYYRDKFNGLADQFKIGCHVVDMSQEEFPWILESNMDEAWKAAPKNRTALLEQAQNQIERSRQAYSNLLNRNRKV